MKLNSFGATNDLMRDYLADIPVIDILLNRPPADPRARALWAKQHQGTGPTQEPLRVRGRNNHYKEKG